MFDPQPKARADLSTGVFYAISGENDWIYFGQISRDKRVGFFRHREHTVASPISILAYPIMSVLSVSYPSITRALRTGSWTKLGKFELASDLSNNWPTVLWSVGALEVEVHDGPHVTKTRFDAADIQMMEVDAVWDAVDHIPARLTADFGQEEPRWDIGGPVWRERRVKEEYAKRFSNSPWHNLPEGWS